MCIYIYIYICLYIYIYIYIHMFNHTYRGGGTILHIIRVHRVIYDPKKIAGTHPCYTPCYMVSLCQHGHGSKPMAPQLKAGMCGCSCPPKSGFLRV